MLDMMAVLDKGVGIAQGTVLCPPAELPLWLFGVDIGLSAARRAVDGKATAFDTVGAYGWTRADATRRAIGEAVERFSLIAPADDDPLLVDPPPPDAAIRAVRELVAYGLLGPTAPVDHLRWVRVLEPLPGTGPASESRSFGVDHLIPSVLVTDPVAEHPWSDGSPSGAASGPDWEFASERALLESVERDAALCCWALRPRVPFVDSLDLAARTGTLNTEGRADVAEYLSRHHARALTVVLPTDAGVGVALTFVDGMEDGVPVLATGARASSSIAECVSVSLREALQVHGALMPLLSLPRPVTLGSPAVDEETRGWACLSSAAVDHLATWVERAGVVDADAVAVDDDARPTADMMVESLRARGLRPFLADLTPRLPASLRAAGWCSVRAIVLGHQQYRMDDTKLWSWHRPRVDDWSRRLVAPGRFDANAVGHPLI